MKVNRDKTIQLMNEYCAGNYTRFARELGVDPSHIHRYLKNDIGGGKKIVGAVINFCKSRGINFEDYIDF
jgi:transposase InsO family protein